MASQHCNTIPNDYETEGIEQRETYLQNRLLSMVGTNQPSDIDLVFILLGLFFTEYAIHIEFFIDDSNDYILRIIRYLGSISNGLKRIAEDSLREGKREEANAREYFSSTNGKFIGNFYDSFIPRTSFSNKNHRWTVSGYFM
ncbi:hypothetical protein [Pasteuria penetrans]|uniref:hypothetical protein n=1 Tax=Pasteuria penetrans TaxID=86005 RepID=UPI000F906426|nr:hypothetical protein [Pasteuria penetrans]